MTEAKEEDIQFSNRNLYTEQNLQTNVDLLNNHIPLPSEKSPEEILKYSKQQGQKRVETFLPKSNCLEKLLLFNVIKILFKAISLYKNTEQISLDKINFLAEDDNVAEDYKIFSEKLEQLGDIDQAQPKQIFDIILFIYRKYTRLIYLAITLYITGKLVISVLINAIIQEMTDYFNESSDYSERNLYIYLALLYLSMSISNISYFYAIKSSYVVAVKKRTLFQYMIYSKISKLSRFQIQDSNIGKIINLCSNDFNIIENKSFSLYFYKLVPFCFIFSIVIMILRFGAIGLFSIFITVVLVIVQVVFLKKYQQAAMERSTFNDQRIKVQSEIVEGIKLIKMYACEGQFYNLVKVVREKELGKTLKLFVYFYISYAVNSAIGLTGIISQIALLYYTENYSDLTTGKIFATFDLLQYLKHLLVLSLFGVTANKEYLNIMERGKEILRYKDFKAINIDEQEKKDTFEKQQQEFEKQCKSDENLVIEFKNFHGFWNNLMLIKDKKVLQRRRSQRGSLGSNFSLTDINFKAHKSQLTTIIGKVGQGKSSLMLSLLEEMPLQRGHLYKNGSIAFVEQEPFIFPGTVKDNIILGQKIDEMRYEQAIETSCLAQDLKIMQKRDQTLIGERGANLSGGQKARLSLARAIYQDCDIYLLDDPLSAVDAKVGKQIINNVIKGILKEKTILLATHQVHYCQDADYILYLDNGRIKDQGTYIEMKDQINQLVGEINRDLLNKRKQTECIQNIEEIELEIQEQQINGEQQQQQQIVKQEDIQVQEKPIEEVKDQEDETEKEELIQIKLQTYLTYIKNSKSIPLIIASMLVLIGEMVLYLVLNNQLGKFQDNSKDEQENVIWYMLAILCAFIFLHILRYIMWTIAHLKSVKTFQMDLMKSLLLAKPSFFDTTPTGKILNRFSNDTGLTDIPILQAVADVVYISVYCIIILIYLVSLNIYLIFSIIVLLLFFFFTTKLAKQAMVKSRIMDLNTRSPIYTFMQTALGGIQHLRIYKQMDNFLSIFNNLSDNSQRVSYFFFMIGRGFVILINYGNVTLGFLTIFINAVVSINSSSIDSSYSTGAAIVLLIFFGDLSQWGLLQFINMDVGFGSLQRLQNFINDIPQEQQQEQGKQKSMFQHNTKKINKKDQQIPQMQSLTTKGQIEFKGVSMKYKEGQKNVLSDLNFTIQPGQKIGCVGRTGAGKSSIIQALFRMNEIEDLENQEKGIFIDGHRIQDYNLQLVRSSIGIIPQQAFLFTGTIKSNLDPQNKYTDEQVMELLKSINLIETVGSVDDGIHSEIDNSQSLFSIGQKQLICLGRCVLNQSKIIVLDEATANIDMHTDEIIQQKIKEKFSQSTVFTIAHRLNTIADYDKILVMDKGQVAEFDHPFTLLAKNENDTEITNNDTIFSQMVKSTGKLNAQQIFKIAKKQYLQSKK